MPAYLTRSGVFTYRNQDGTVRREYRPASEVFDAASLKSLEDAPVTDLHQGMVRADSYQTLSKGHVRDVKQDGQFIAGTVLVQDAALVAAVERRDRTEISCGYDCRLDMTPGVTPDGEPYDATQTEIRYNHAALLPAGTGRAGRAVALRLDGAAFACHNEGTKMNVHFDGKDYDLANPAELASYNVAVAAHQARLDAAETAVKTADAARAKTEAERDAAVKDRDAARADAADARDPAKLAARVAERGALEGKARELLGADTKFDALTDDQIREACVLKSDPEAKTRFDAHTGESRAVYVSARFDSLQTPAASVRAAIVMSTLPADVQASGTPIVNAWDQPLAMSKDKK